MIVPDIIVCWPRNCDFPLWREFIRDNRSRFNLVIIVFTETHYGPDYKQFVRDAMQKDYVLFIEGESPRNPDDDWRDLAIHQALLQSYNAEWIWFTEQDFIVKDGFWDTIDAVENFDVIAAFDNTRMHPCSIFIKREALNKTRKRFGIVKDVSDHFSQFQKELQENGSTIYGIPKYLYEHLNGLSHNLKLIWEGNPPVWQAERFNNYLKETLNVTVPLSDEYKQMVLNYLNRLGL